jgi:hypothetical protein
MFVLFLSLGGSVPACDAPNTVKTKSEQCVCRHGFPYGFPTSPQGCYACADPCHPMAMCAYPGTCICNRTYHGDGVRTCAQELPSITSLSPTTGPADGGTIVTVHYACNLSGISHGYCLFGRHTVLGSLESGAVMHCRTPPGPPVPQFVSIMFDGSEWSTTPVFFEYRAVKPSPMSKSELRALAYGNGTLIVLVIVLAISLVECQGTNNSQRIYQIRTMRESLY